MVKNYIGTNFAKSFLTIFVPFFLIISLVYLVKIAVLTSKIEISLVELFLMYGYSLPDIFFYTIPLSFMGALSTMLIRLSQENELVALFSLGLNSKELVSYLLKLSLIFSFLLASISFLAMPLSYQYYKSFRETKKGEAKLNINAGELGQKFGDYYIYVQDKKDNIFYDIVIYSRINELGQHFFASKTGELKHNNNITSLKLNNGYGYTYTEGKLKEIEYDTLQVYNDIEIKEITFENVLTHWSKIFSNKRVGREFMFFLFMSLIPLLSLYPIASFSIINPRYQKNRSSIVLFILVLIFYGFGSFLQKSGNIFILIPTIILFLILGLKLFKKRVSKYF